MNTIDCNWQGDMAFEVHVNNHTLTIDADDAVGGKDFGPRPKPLMLAALAGCTGMDVVSILKKMREPLSWFNIKINAELTEEHPKYYNKVQIVYQFRDSDGLNKDNIMKAIELSQTKYCGVAAMFRQFADVGYSVEYL